MKSYENDDELERALFALPLEEPPAGLRSAILAGTAYRTPAPFKLWEGWVLGGLVAVAIWLFSLIVAGGEQHALQTFNVIAATVAEFLAEPQTLIWLAIGGATALWLSQINLTPLSLKERQKNR